MTRYVLHICCLDNHISGTGQMRAWTNPMPYAHNVSLTKEVPEFWKNWLEFSNIASTPFEVVCVLMPWKASEEKIHRLSLTTATNISNRLVDWLGGLVGSNLALLAGFSFESYFLPYLLQNQRNRSTWTKLYLSQVTSTQIISNQCLCQDLRFKARSLTNAFPHRNGCKRVVDIPIGHFSRKTQNGKCMENMLWFPLGFENLEDAWWQLCNIANLLGICPQTSWDTNNPWLCILHPTPAASASSSAYQGLARWKMKELIPKWCQQIQIDSIAVTFEPNHPICLEKKGHTKASLTSQDNSDSSIAMEILEKNWWTQTLFVKLVQYIYIAGIGIGWKMNICWSWN